MPAKSKAQFKLMKAICEGTYPDGYRGISKKLACEFIKGQSPKGLPERKVRKMARKKSTKRSKAMKKVALKRLGRKKATGNFRRIEEKAAKRYHSKAAGKRVAAAIYWRIVKNRKKKK